MFYLKLAGQNIRKSIGVFAPFVLASLVLFTLICSMFLLMLSPVMKTMGTGAVSIGLGVVVLTIFSVIMEIYSFNFLMKQRAREFGLYNMLGMNKKKVALIASIELMMIFLLVVVLGSVLAGVFANVLYLIFVNITHYSDLHFGIEPLAFVMTAFLFAGFFFLLELLAIRTIGKTSPLILFRASEKGEREPKGNVLLAALGVLSLGMGYYLSLSSKAEGLAVIYRFFIAVLFVIAGTYLFYISFMTWYLKARRKNKRYFYTPEHFITTSQMIFRMKQHATGLANITLLAVMAFVTIATTTSLYTGMANMTSGLYPKETSITYKVSYRSQGVAAYQQSVLSHFPEKANDNLSYLTYQAGLVYDGGSDIVINPETIANPDFSKMAFTYFITQDDFRKLGNDLPELAANQVAFMRPSEMPSLKKLVLGDQTFENVANQEGVDCQLAIETSGHAAFKENYFLDDGTYVAAKILMLLPKLQAEGKSLDDLIAQLKQPLETQEVRFKLEAAGYRALGEQVIADFRNTSLEGFAFNPENEEGVRFDLTELYGDGWLLLRMSLHEPLLVLQVENDQTGHIPAVLRTLSAFLDQYPAVNQEKLKALI